MIKDENESLNEKSTYDSVGEELLLNMKNENVPTTDPPKEEQSNETMETKYKGRGRPRKGQQVKKEKKEKRVPKPPNLEMCQICGQLFRCIKTHMFVHDTNPQVRLSAIKYICYVISSINNKFSRFDQQFECHHCGRKFKHKPNLICHVKNHQNVR